MPTLSGQQSAHKLAHKNPIAPKVLSLSAMPETPEALFRAVALNVSTVVQQPDPSGKGSAKKQDYTLPWAGFTHWRDARARLLHFEKSFKDKLDWAPFNDTSSNDGPMSLNAFPGRAFIERVTNEGDGVLEAKAAEHKGPMPKSPGDAASLWYGLNSQALAGGMDDDALRAVAQRTVTVTGFLGDPADPKDSIFDARDFGIGLTAAEMPRTILSLNRGNKKSKPWLTGKHGQGASSTYQYADLTLIASRKVGSSKVAFTFVEGAWDIEDGIPAKTPTYKYLTIDGNVPEVEIPESEFPVGTLVRHIGYQATDLFSAIGEHSLYGLLLRSLAEPIFPIWLEVFSLRPGKSQGYPTFPGFRRWGRLIRGTVNVLEKAWQKSLSAVAAQDSGADDIDADIPKDEENSGTKILHRASEFFQLPKWDYGGRVGVGDLGKVKYTWWVVDPASRRSEDVVRNWVDPNKTILMTLDGQTHSEEARAIITGQRGANLWAVGRYMIVQIDCGDLDPKAKYEMFTSTREHSKETPIKKMILEELVRRLGFDKKLEQLNIQFAAADVKQPEEKDDTIASLIKKYLKAAGISFEQLTRKVEKWTEVEEQREISARPSPKDEIPPIQAVEPPTFVRWRFSGTSVKLHPGQRYSFVFETDASPSYWKPEDQTSSKIKVLAHGISYVGSGEMKGGRVRCHFECPQDATIGAKGYIQVQLDYSSDASKTHRLPVDIVEKPQPHHRQQGDNLKQDDKGDKTKTIKVKVRKKDFSEVEIPVLFPIPVKQSDNAWNTLAWPHDTHRVGFSIRSLGGKIQLYYNAEFPPFLDMKHKMSKKSLETEFVRRYELKLVIHTMFTLNYDFADEDDFSEEQRKRVRDLLCATAESLALATKSELEIESRLKSEDNAPLESVVAANLQSASLATAESDSSGMATAK
jgi:hypothetical protein